MASDPPPAYSTLDTSTTNLTDIEEGTANSDDVHLITNSFEDKSTRIAFIQKVLTLKLLQLLLVAAVMGIFLAKRYDLERYMRVENHRETFTVIFILALVAIVCLLAKVCKDRNRRQNPLRYLFLVLYPLSYSLVVSALTLPCDYLPPVLIAWLMYCGAVLAVILYSIFALQTKLEFAAKYGCVLAILVQIFFFVVIALFSYLNALCILLYLSIVLAVDITYVIWDVEIMTTKSYWTHIAPDEFFDGVLNLHVDYYYIVCKYLYPKLIEDRDTTVTS